ncbi:MULTISPECIES: hypothetical protein [Bacillus subtilis group]|uniref:hypothetical protein n=1 Tax=Bacillus amyloliquefaciens group TaxID=1938374 RepID=UPI001B954A6F|nr:MULTISPECIES: hypothetical protein [Bacillus subtilis group]MEC5261239.1 hypothetical protein [Bacillus amyloliquefaciens]MED0777917.1 hypothetical protein [Bacillus siamensis]MED0780796.1 hypothetical protein [Bacillus siamensis]MED0833615.1 hypothetical protein [Bacillus siamensis]CAF1771923.1 hypothetical protein NRS6120_02179 [Bacillus subtilis]
MSVIMPSVARSEKIKYKEIDFDKVKTVEDVKLLLSKFNFNVREKDWDKFSHLTKDEVKETVWTNC